LPRVSLPEKVEEEGLSRNWLTQVHLEKMAVK